MVAKSWQLIEISAIPQGQSQGKKQYLHCYWVLGTQPEECVRIFPFPSRFDHLNLTHDFSLIVVIILLIMAVTLDILPFRSIAHRTAVFFWAFERRRRRYLGSVDFVPGTAGALLLDFHNCHYCTPQELDPTRAVHKVWMVALYGTLEQPCGNQMCTVLIFRRNIKACQTISNNGADLFLNFLIHSFG